MMVSPYLSYWSSQLMSFIGLHWAPRTPQPAAPDLPLVPSMTWSSTFLSQLFSCSIVVSVCKCAIIGEDIPHCIRINMSSWPPAPESSHSLSTPSGVRVSQPFPSHPLQRVSFLSQAAGSSLLDIGEALATAASARIAV